MSCIACPMAVYVRDISYLVRLAIISLLCGAYKSTDQVNFCDRDDMIIDTISPH